MRQRFFLLGGRRRKNDNWPPWKEESFVSYPVNYKEGDFASEIARCLHSVYWPRTAKEDFNPSCGLCRSRRSDLKLELEPKPKTLSRTKAKKLREQVVELEPPKEIADQECVVVTEEDTETELY